MSQRDDKETVAWPLDGDPVIRWQTMRDLLDEPAEVWEAERRRVGAEGWSAAMLEHRAADGSWPKGRWTDSPWSLLRKPNGRWPLQKGIPGTPLVEMEKPGGESRWTTCARSVSCARRR